MLKGLRKKALILSISSQLLVLLNSDDKLKSCGPILKQVQDFEVALKAMDYLLDDRTPEGTKLLKEKLKEHDASQSDQPAGIFHLALGVMEFIEATLGFEPEVMAKAHQTLSDAETASINNSKYNVKHNLVTSHIYPPGTEFQVTNAESTLLNALVMLLQENNGMVESAKALYKLRRAYHTLDSVYKKIKELEPVFNKNIAKLRKQSSKSLNHSVSSVDLPGIIDEDTETMPPDFKLMKDLEMVFQMRKNRIEGTNLGNSIDPSKVNLFADISANLSSITLSRRASSVLDKGKPVDVGSAVGAGTGAARGGSKVDANSGFRAPKIEVSSAEAKESDDEDEFSDALDTLDESGDLSGSIPAPNIDSSTASILTESSNEKNDTYLHVSTIDEFIHSGVQLCFGILQVVLSLIPPAIGKVLSIVGFRGERDVGLRLLWRNAITCRNIHGDLALLCLLVFYDGPVQFVDQGFQLPQHSNANVSNVIDISARTSISDQELDKVMMNPDFYTPQLLDKVRNIFPHNALWVLQQGRVLASHGQLQKAIDMMQAFTDDPNNKIQMQQSEALLIFDRGTLYAFNHQFDEAANDFIKLIDLSSWCKSVYLLMAGSCYAAKYRQIKMGLIKYETEAETEKQLKKYSDLAKKYMKLAPTYVPGHGSNASGRKGGIGGGTKQLPFDKFVLRRTKQLDDREKQYPNVEYVELMGTSMIHELMYFWNGYNRMGPQQLKLALEILGYSGSKGSEYSANNDEINYSKIDETEDELMIRCFLQSICLRSLGKISEGLNLLDTQVISKFVVLDSPFKFNRMNYSPYLCPTVMYEKTMFVWLLKSSKPNFDGYQASIDAKGWLKKASALSDLGDYELSNRTNMRIKAASEKLDQITEMCS